jgi:hypothetical protein
MTGNSSDPQRSVWWTVAGVVAATAAVGLVALLTVPRGAGSDGYSAVAVAGVACLASSLAAVALSELLRRGGAVLAGVLVSMLVRLAAPLAVAVVVQLRFESLVRAGFAYYLLAFYLVNLAVETVLSVRQARGPARPSSS